MENTNYTSISIKITISETIDDWTFGGFYILTAGGKKIGNPDDMSVDIKGCMHWIEDFIQRPRDRYEPGLFEMDKKQVYSKLATPVLVCEGSSDNCEEIYRDTYARFHISHIGMSSFELQTILLIQNQQGCSRIIWGSSADTLQELNILTSDLEAEFLNAATQITKLLTING